MGKRSKHVYNGGNLTLGGLPTLKLCDGRSCKMHSGLLLSTRHGTMGHGDTHKGSGLLSPQSCKEKINR